MSELQREGARGISLVNLDPQATEVALRCLGTFGRTTRNGTSKQERLAYYLGTEAEADNFDFYSIDAD